MVWKTFFPWNPIKTKYSGSESQIVTGNCLLEKCNIKGITGNPVIKCSDIDALILMDQCRIDSCIATSSQGILYLQLTESGSCVIHSSCFVNSRLSSTDVDMLCTIHTSSSNSGMTKIYKSSFVSCGTSSFRSSHMIYIENGYQECHEMNISKCHAYYRTIDHDHTSNGISSWGNFEGNSVGRILLYFNYKGIVKKSNIIRNDQKRTDSGHYGLVVTSDAGSFLIAEGCYLAENDCRSICYIESGTVHFIQCCILDKTTNIKNAVIHNNFSFEKITLEVCIPAITKCSKKNAIVSVFFGIIMTSQFIKEKS